MNKKVSNKSRIVQKNNSLLSLAVMVIFLLCGGVAGCILALYAQHIPDSIFFRHDIVSVVQNEVDAYSFWSTYFNLIKYPFIIFLLSFTAFGYMIIPLIISLKSFFLTFSISTVLQLYGIKRFVLSISMFGIQTFLSIPALLLTATLGVEISKYLSVLLEKGKGNLINNDKLIFKYVIVFVALLFFLLLFTFLDITITPLLVSLSLKWWKYDKED